MRRTLLVLMVASGLMVAATAATGNTRQPLKWCLFQAIAPTDACAGDQGASNILRVEFQTSPGRLPTDERVPIGVKVTGTISSVDGTRPPDLREALIDLDRKVRIDTAGLPSCARSVIERLGSKAVRHRCRGAIVGRGRAQIGRWPSDGSRPTVAEAALTLFNGGAQDGVAKLFIHSSTPPPNPGPHLAVIEVRKADDGHFGHRAVARIPPLPSELSMISFQLEIDRRVTGKRAPSSYLSAKCNTDGNLRTRIVKAELRERGSNAPEPFIAESFARSCSPAATPASSSRAPVEDVPYVFCTFRAGDACGSSPSLAVSGDVQPRVLPRREMAPVAVRIRGSIGTANGSLPPSLREVVFDLDRNVKLDPTAFPVCEPIHGSTRDVRRDLSADCPESIVGRGTAEIAFASGRPSEEVPLTFFNAGVVNGVTGLAVQTKVIVPFTTGVMVERARKGRYGHAATWRPRLIAGGDAVLTKFNFRLKRGYMRARCTDGKLLANITKALFRDEVEGSKSVTTLKGAVIRPCTPRP